MVRMSMSLTMMRDKHHTVINLVPGTTPLRQAPAYAGLRLDARGSLARARMRYAASGMPAPREATRRVAFVVSEGEQDQRTKG